MNAVPGVEKAGGIHLLPLTLNNWSFPYVAEDNPVPDGTPPPDANQLRRGADDVLAAILGKTGAPADESGAA